MIKSILMFILCINSFSLSAQVEKNSDLYKAIMSKDSLLFEVGFNRCDISQFETLMSEDLEFYH
ncbi:MAG: serine hydrolase, partial [Mesonia sp.]